MSERSPRSSSRAAEGNRCRKLASNSFSLRPGSSARRPYRLLAMSIRPNEVCRVRYCKGSAALALRVCPSFIWAWISPSDPDWVSIARCAGNSMLVVVGGRLLEHVVGSSAVHAAESVGKEHAEDCGGPVVERTQAIGLGVFYRAAVEERGALAQGASCGAATDKRDDPSQQGRDCGGDHRGDRHRLGISE